MFKKVILEDRVYFIPIPIEGEVVGNKAESAEVEPKVSALATFFCLPMLLLSLFIGSSALMSLIDTPQRVEQRCGSCAGIAGGMMDVAAIFFVLLWLLGAACSSSSAFGWKVYVGSGLFALMMGVIASIVL